LFLNSNNPREELFEELAREGDDPLKFLQRSWATGKIVHRQFVASFLKENAAANLPWLPRAEPLMLDCVNDADLSVRELGMAALEATHNPQLFDAAKAQVHGLDPFVRLLGLGYLRKSDPKKTLPILIRLLDDPDLRVVTEAEAGLMRWSGVDFGVRLHMAIPQGSNGSPDQIGPANAEAIRRGIEQRKQWWQIHQNDYSAIPNSSSSFVNNESAHSARPPAPNFNLRNIDGKSVSLSDFKGKVVLLNFWATWCTACLAEIPELVALQKKLGNQVAIIGIALDGVPDEHDDVPGHDGDGKPDSNRTSLNAARAKVQRFVETHQINYPVLLDPNNSVGGQYNGGELPTTVIIDADGRVRRRFVGERSLGVFEAMIAEAQKRQ